MRKRLTTAELKLWSVIRNRQLDGLRFRRQAPLGPYIVDFFCPERRLVVEVDGGPHTHAYNSRADAERDEWLRSQGHTVLRFANPAIMKGLDSVCAAIVAASQGSPGCLR
jgi:very-short-patch-repair endonuclease